MPYDRTRAVTYAARWWANFNPAFRAFPENDCTNFISQCLWAGGMPMEDTGHRGQGWWYRGPNEEWSFSWAVADSLRWFLETSGRGRRVPSARHLELGDIISYDFDGDGSYDHNAIVVGRDGSGEPLVAAHTAPSWGRAWDYTDSPAYAPGRTKYLFWQIRVP